MNIFTRFRRWWRPEYVLARPHVSGVAWSRPAVQVHPVANSIDQAAACQRMVGDLIRETRLYRKLTQAQCAGAAGMPRSTWSDIEHGKVHLTPDRLRRVAIGLGAKGEPTP